MAYHRTNWKSGAEGGTLVSDERLNNIEDGIQQALAGIPDVALPDAVMTAVAGDPTTQFAIQQNATFAPTDMATSFFATVKSRLDLDMTDVVIGVVGDSTGAGNSADSIRWPWLFAQHLAALYPTKTVAFYPWNNTTVGYDAPVTVQTGSGSQTITVYNGSASGQNTTYSQINLLAILPVSCDLVFINHGHNMVGSDDTEASEKYYSLGRDILRWVAPSAALVYVSQNPRTDGSAAAHQVRLNKMMQVCATNGWGVLNVTQAFLDTPNWQALINVDGIHPTNAGETLWSDYLWGLFSNPRVKYAAPKSAPAAVDRLWIPGNALLPNVIVGTTPAPAIMAGWPCMEFGNETATITANASVMVPPSWQKVNVWLWWTVHFGGAGNVGWEFRYGVSSRIGTETATGYSATSLSSFQTPTPAAYDPAPAANYGEKHTLLLRNTVLGISGNPQGLSKAVYFEIRRLASNASDTFANSAFLLGIVVERAL